MKIRRFFCITLVFCIIGLTLVSCNNVNTGANNTDGETTQNQVTDTPENTEKKEDETPTKTNYSILFIGNSYTYYNDLPSIFKSLGESSGYQLEVNSITNGGHKLSQHADPNDQYGKLVEQALTGDKKYDYIILQEQSIRPITDDAPDFYSAVRNLAERIRKTGAEPILYSTWGRKTGHSTLKTYGWTNESMTWKLAASYQKIGDELNIKVAHVGLAFYDIYTTKKGLELYDPDMTHPSFMGSYLSAMTLFTKIFNIDPYTVKYNANLPESRANMFRDAAKKAVFETPAIPAQYK